MRVFIHKLLSTLNNFCSQLLCFIFFVKNVASKLHKNCAQELIVPEVFQFETTSYLDLS